MINLSLSDEQMQIAETVRDALSSVDIKELRASPERTWEILRELGAATIRVGENCGGWGGSLLDAAIVAGAAGSQGRIDILLPAIASFGLLDHLDDPAGLLSGTFDGDGVDERIVLAVQDVGIFPIQPMLGLHAGTSVLFRNGERIFHARLPSDADRPIHDGVGACDFSTLREAKAIAGGNEAITAFQTAVCEYRILLAAAMAGMARQAIADASAYASERNTFGSPIGAYQGVAHRLADAITETEGTELLIWRAVSAIAQKDDRAPELEAQAFWWACHASRRAITSSMRVFGGYGMTNDSRLPTYYITVREAALMFGDPDRVLDEACTPRPMPDAGAVQISFTPDDEARALEARATEFLDRHFGAEEKAQFAASKDNHIPELHRKLAEAGLLYPDWPENYGGIGASPGATSAARRVLGRRGWPLSVIVVTDMVGKLLMRFGTEQAKREILPVLASGEALCCLGMSESSGGSDVFGARTRAAFNGEMWVANGQKVFTTSAHIARYVLLLARTDSAADAPEGLTLFLVPLPREGFEAHAVQTFAGERTNITFYSDFEFDGRYLLGEVGKGSKVLAAALELEHSMGDYYLAAHDIVLSDLGGDMDRLMALPGMHDNREAIQHSLARFAAHVSLLEVLSIRSLWAKENHVSRRWHGPMCKLFGTESWSALNDELVRRFAPHSITGISEALRTLEAESRRGIPATIYGGTSEIQRSVIAETALSLPRSRARK